MRSSGRSYSPASESAFRFDWALSTEIKFFGGIFYSWAFDASPALASHPFYWIGGLPVRFCSLILPEASTVYVSCTLVLSRPVVYYRMRLMPHLASHTYTSKFRKLSIVPQSHSNMSSSDLHSSILLREQCVESLTRLHSDSSYILLLAWPA